MDMPPDFDRLADLRDDGRRSARRKPAVWLLGAALFAAVLGVAVAALTGPGFVMLDSAGTAFGP